MFGLGSFGAFAKFLLLRENLYLKLEYVESGLLNFMENMVITGEGDRS